ncbi:MAG: hypothetical protein HQL81_07265 [Magnetococcales bacterium]|nr:hypothetical protein [Magnetococcales bacterium]
MTRSLPFLMLASLGLAIWSGTYLIAELWVNPARHLIQIMSNPDLARDADTIDDLWPRATASLLSARLLVPGNAEYHLWDGWLHQRQAERSPPWSNAAKGALQSAENAYGEALHQRPSWGLPWINRAQVRVRQGFTDEVTMADLQRAVHFDPHNPHIVKQAMRLGFALWHGMDRDERVGFLHLLQKNVSLMPYDTIDLARRQGLLDQIRPFYAADPKFRQLWEKKLGPGR